MSEFGYVRFRLDTVRLAELSLLSQEEHSAISLSAVDMDIRHTVVERAVLVEAASPFVVVQLHFTRPLHEDELLEVVDGMTHTFRVGGRHLPSVVAAQSGEPLAAIA